MLLYVVILEINIFIRIVNVMIDMTILVISLGSYSFLMIPIFIK